MRYEENTLELNESTKEHVSKRWIAFCVFVFIIFFACGFSVQRWYHPLLYQYGDVDRYSISMYNNVRYGDGDYNKYDLYLPKEKKDSYGLILYLHGGSFMFGDKKDTQATCMYLCSKGYVVASVNYTLVGESNPEATVFKQSEEVKNSVPKIIKEAKRRGYVIDRMATSGNSAGGCLALLYSYKDASESPVPVKMTFNTVPAASFCIEDWEQQYKDTKTVTSLLSALTGIDITEESLEDGSYEVSVRDMSPDVWVNQYSVPTICAFGAKDKVIPFKSSERFIKTLEKNEVDHKEIIFQHSGHSLQNDDEKYVEYMDTVLEYLDQYLAKA